MGIDVLDVTFRIEKAFDVELSRMDFEGLVRNNDVTVGSLYELILKKLHLRDVARHDLGLHYDLWEEIQGILHRALDVRPESIELATPLEVLFPREGRREAWSALREASPYRIAELEYTSTVRVAGFLLAAGMVLVEQFRLWRIAGIKWLWPLLGLCGIWMVSETYLKILSICAPLRKSFPAGMTNVKDLCRAVLAANYLDVCGRFDLSLDERCITIWEQLTGILSDALGVDPEEVEFRSRLIRDLGMS